MAHPFPAAMLAQVVAHVLTQCGFTSFSQATVHVLVDVLERYLAAAGSRAAAVAELAGRSHVQLLDTVVALHALGEDVTALHEFVHAGWTKPLANLDVDLRLEKVPQLPVPIASTAQGRVKDIEEREIARAQATGFPLHVSHDLLRDYFQMRPSLDAVLVVDPTPAPVPDKETELEARAAAVAAETADEPMAVDSPAAATIGEEHPARSPPLAPTSPSLASPPPPPPLPLPSVPTAHYDAAHFPAHIPTHLPPFPAADAARHDDFHLPFPASALPPPPPPISSQPPTVSPERQNHRPSGTAQTATPTATTAPDAPPVLQHLDRTAILALHSKPIHVPNPKTGSMAAPVTASAPAPRPSPKPSAYLRKRQGKGQAAALQRAMRAADRANAVEVAPPLTGGTVTDMPAADGAAAGAGTSGEPPAATTAAAPPPPTPSSASSPAPLVGPRTAPTPAIASGTAVLKPLHRRAVVLATAGDALFAPAHSTDLNPLFPSLAVVPAAADEHGGKRAADEIRCMCDHARNDDGGFMVACDACHVWFHGKCVGVALGVLQDGDQWVCPRCTRAGRGFK
ncbi:hypothetical protein AMAG_11012 [Allomyces macrogynus ATCC 38327]|uniref:PHD-type domain-containing protein n=1 Tax=Allomyces macrogynus (strain ATCC 38327) TaxID=578462 RepID=A0A0L0SSQ5_ALLM3|nr:hypothetical protein AMAG_11012 [Allomyces macrogynus ATCC 38327]|eukprot:KNE65374.1 hypothetical protein AMAG_11012 [Allomyces macrogynus ATCC 38327]